MSQTLLRSALSISAWTPYSSKIGKSLLVELHLRRQRRHDALDQLEHAAEFDVVVDADGRIFLGQQVAQELGDEALLAVDHRRRARRLGLLADLGPDLVEVAQVRDDVVLGAAGGRGADDDAAGEPVLLAELADDAAQPAALVARFDLARDADVVHRRHEHQEAAGHRRVRREAGALGAERLLGDLDDDFLAFLEEVFDFRLGAFFASRRPSAPPVAATLGLGLPRRSAAIRSGRGSGRRIVLVGLEAVELLEGGDDVGDVEEAVALETEVNERRLHAGQHLRHPALVEIADDAALTLALDEHLGDQIVLEDRDPRFVGARGDDHLLGHARSSWPAVRLAPSGSPTHQAGRQQDPDQRKHVQHSP